MIDSCVFHPPTTDEKAAMDKLWELDHENKIKLEIAEATEEEMKKAPLRFRSRVNARISAGVKLNGLDEIKRKKEIIETLFPDKPQLTVSDRIDVQNIFVASEWAYYYFVTYDKKHILNKADVIKEKFKIRVITPSQCLREVIDLLKTLNNMKDMENRT